MKVMAKKTIKDELELKTNIVTMYTEEGISITEIAKKLGVGQTTVRKTLVDGKIPIVGTGGGMKTRQERINERRERLKNLLTKAAPAVWLSNVESNLLQGYLQSSGSKRPR